MSTTFRPAAPSSVEAAPERVVEVESTVVEKPSAEVAPTLYQEEHGKPYLTKLLDIENTYTELDADLQSNIDAIEDYFKTKVRAKEIENDSVGYKELFKRLEKITDSSTRPLSVKLGLIAEYLKYIERSKRYTNG